MRKLLRVNMAMTLDGHTAHPQQAWNFGSSEDRRRMDRLRAWADCLIVSRRTLEHDNMDLRVRTNLQARHPRPVVVLHTARPLQQGLLVTQYPGPAGELWLYGEGNSVALDALWPDRRGE
ncbi:MAG: dihydrofolate reductase family protein, partial [Leptospiraceae bacterium]|nr:dihydrofolate reductase family protein [Leptospiraceae bacterium]